MGEEREFRKRADEEETHTHSHTIISSPIQNRSFLHERIQMNTPPMFIDLFCVLVPSSKARSP